MNELRFYILMIVILPLTIKGQDYRYSQFYNAPLLLNPALTGEPNTDYRLNANYKTQWSAISDAYKTVSASYDMPMFEDLNGISKMGLGLSFLSDKAGSTNYGFTNINLSAAYHIKSNRYNKLSAGLLVGYGQSSVDLSDVKWESQHNGNNHDPSAASGESVFVDQIRYLDAGLGVYWTLFDPEYGRKYELGLSVMHVNFPNHSFKGKNQERLNPKIQLHAGIDLEFYRFILKPKLHIMNQGPSYYFNIGSLVRFELSDKPDSRYTDAYVSSAFDLGLFYRYNESIMITAQYEFKRKLLIALSYDYTISELSAISSSGGYEIALKYQGMFKNQKIKIRGKMDKEKKDKPKGKRKKNAPNIRM